MSAYNAGHLGSIPGWGRFSGEGNGNPLQYSCLENSMDRGAWQATVHGVAKSRTQLNDFTFTLIELTPQKDVLFIVGVGVWNAKLGSQEISGIILSKL